MTNRPSPTQSILSSRDAGSEMIPSRWLQRGLFDHAAHRNVDLPDIATSRLPQRSSPRELPEDQQKVMIAGIDSCTACHRSEELAETSGARGRRDGGDDRAGSRLGHPIVAHFVIAITRRMRKASACPTAAILRYRGRGRDEFRSIVIGDASLLRNHLLAVGAQLKRGSRRNAFVGKRQISRRQRSRLGERPVPRRPVTAVSKAEAPLGIMRCPLGWPVTHMPEPDVCCGTRTLAKSSSDWRPGLRVIGRPMTTCCELAASVATPVPRRRIARRPGTQATGTQATGTLDERLLTQGVHCESCHGSAEKWLEPHLRSIGAAQRFDPATGMRDTESIVGRAATCVRCHVGSRSEDGMIRDMNHDLIAAGHPALRFDLLIYNDNLPKHWDGRKRSGAASSRIGGSCSSSRPRDEPVAAGIVGLGACRDHLQDRSAAPWPELSDYDCFACHQSLSMQEYLLPPRGNGQMKSPLHVSDGLPVWNSWHTVGNELEIRGNRRALEILSPHRSDPAQIAPLAKQIAERFREKASRAIGLLLTKSTAI